MGSGNKVAESSSEYILRLETVVRFRERFKKRGCYQHLQAAPHRQRVGLILLPRLTAQSYMAHLSRLSSREGPTEGRKEAVSRSVLHNEHLIWPITWQFSQNRKSHFSLGLLVLPAASRVVFIPPPFANS